VRRDGKYHKTVSGLTSFVDTGLSAGKTYSYEIVSVDEDQQDDDRFSDKSASALRHQQMSRLLNNHQRLHVLVGMRLEQLKNITSDETGNTTKLYLDRHRLWIQVCQLEIRTATK